MLTGLKGKPLNVCKQDSDITQVSLLRSFGLQREKRIRMGPGWIQGQLLRRYCDRPKNDKDGSGLIWDETVETCGNTMHIRLVQLDSTNSVVKDLGHTLYFC